MSDTDRIYCPESLAEKHETRYGQSDRLIIAAAPGRVNLIGDHTDYNGGLVLPITIDRSAFVAMSPSSDFQSRAFSIQLNESITYDYRSTEFDCLPHWSKYLFGVHRELYAQGKVASGVDVVFDGDVPIGRGLSSSAALEVACVAAFERVFDFLMDPIDTVKLCQRVEHYYAGVQCGIMDQFASRLGTEGHALYLDCRSLEHQLVPVSLVHHSFLIVVTKVRRSLASSGYNKRRSECETALRHFQQVDPAVTTLRDVSPDLFAGHGSKLPDRVFRRVRHVLSENRRVQDAATALLDGDVETFGRLMSESHHSLAVDYEASHPELDFAVRTANEMYGTLGARMTGAGFGGCAVVLTRCESTNDVAERLKDGFQSAFGYAPELIVLNGNHSTRLVPHRRSSGRTSSFIPL